MTKLPHLDDWNQSRRQTARLYDELLQDTVCDTPACAAYSEHVYHLYVVRCEDRTRTQQRLQEAGIGCGLHYPVPIHLQEAYDYLGYAQGDFPHAEKACAQILSLPMCPGLTREEIDEVADALRTME